MCACRERLVPVASGWSGLAGGCYCYSSASTPSGLFSPHLPPRLNPRLRCVVPVRRIVDGLPMRFLFIGPPVSSSLPPAGRLPFQRWLQVVVLSHFHVRFLLQGTCTPFTTRPCWAHTTPWCATSRPRRALGGTRRALEQYINMYNNIAHLGGYL
jgi:hypothetical protein